MTFSADTSSAIPHRDTRERFKRVRADVPRRPNGHQITQQVLPGYSAPIGRHYQRAINFGESVAIMPAVCPDCGVGTMHRTGFVMPDDPILVQVECDNRACLHLLNVEVHAR